jgi:hypothetical protein
MKCRTILRLFDFAHAGMALLAFFNMAEKLVGIDRDTRMLLLPDLRDWVADDDLAHFTIK